MPDQDRADDDEDGCSDPLACQHRLDAPSDDIEQRRTSSDGASVPAAVRREQDAVAVAHADEEFVRRSFRRARDPLILRLRRTLPSELGGHQEPADSSAAEAASREAAREHLRQSGLLGPVSEHVLREAS